MNKGESFHLNKRLIVPYRLIGPVTFIYCSLLVGVIEYKSKQVLCSCTISYRPIALDLNKVFILSWRCEMIE